MKWRFDKRCGSKYPLPDGTAAECDPDSTWSHCCNEENGECGETADHCTCRGCIDYRDVKKWTEAGLGVNLMKIFVIQNYTHRIARIWCTFSHC